MLDRLDDAQRDALLNYASKSLVDNLELDTKEAAEISGLDEHTIFDPLTAISIFVSLTSEIEISKDDVLKFGADRLIDDVRGTGINCLLDFVFDSRKRINAQIERSRLANATLPIIRALNFQIDRRYKFNDDDSVRLSVPVAVFRMKLDSEDEVWFQANQDKISEIIEKLEKVKRRLASVEDMR